MRRALLLLALSIGAVAHSQERPASRDEAYRVAEAYLKALSGEGEESGRELLLGGATMNAQLFSLENWKVVKREAPRREQGELASARQHMSELDRAGREALTRILTSSADPDGLSMTELSQEDAARLMAPTRERARAFLEKHPVMAYVARVGKEVYWHPKNPVRPLLDRTGKSGPYSLELHLFQIETREGPRQEPRVWPLRVVRLKAGKVDTGWKVLPASDWNGE